MSLVKFSEEEKISAKKVKANKLMTDLTEDDLNKDYEIFMACKEGGEYEKRKFFEHFYQLIYRTTRRYLIDPDDLEETIHDSFIKAFQKLKKFEDKGVGVKPWLKRIAINTAIDRYRKLVRKDEIIVMDESVMELEIDATAITDLTYAEIMALVEMLPLVHRTVFYLYEIEGYNHKEISKTIKATEAVSRVYLSRAKRKLKELFIKNFSSDEE